MNTDQEDIIPATYAEAMAELEKARCRIRAVQPLTLLGAATSEIVNHLRNRLTRPSIQSAALLTQTDIPELTRVKIATIYSDLKIIVQYVRLIHDIGHSVEFSKSASEIISVKDLLEEVVTLASHRARIHGKIIEFAIDAPLSRVDLPTAYIRLALMNILSNSIDAISVGSIILKADIHQGWIAIQIRDTGPGMSPQVLATCRDAFFTTKPSSEATGLGLTIVTDVMREINGELTIVSREGSGTCCTLTIPCIPPTP